ncbi:MAG TPA: SurA N-terminal domain-containing protein [Puia sp.]|nr:SurA N-terminal domain-containing protein [Puia sp.]
MSIIQQIRDKAAWLVFGLIALSLVGFLLMDAFVGKSRIFGGDSNTIGSVNGENLDYVKFQRQITEREDQYKAQGYPMNDMMQQNIKDGVWKDFVEEVVMDKVYDKAGVTVGDRELQDMLVGQNAIPDIKRSFTDPKTGIFDAQAAASTINQLRTIWIGNKKSDKNYEQARRFFEEGVPQIIKAREKEKYLSLLSKSVYIPKWMVEKTNADNSQIASISYVNTPYATIPDSTVKVSDDEIKEYVDKHKEQYKQVESRSIAYVTFNAAPTSGDSANVKQQLLNMKNEFVTTKDPKTFLARVGSEIGYFDTYISKSKLQVPNKDSIIALPRGGLFGPYLDASNYVIAKKLDEKLMPDSVRARHILVATVDPQSNQPLLDDSTAKKKIDSIKALIDKGQRFDSLAAKLSDDQGSKIKGGDLGYFSNGQMVKEFNDFCFNGKAGDEKIVKTQFGYHLIEILDQKGFEPAYKVAYLAKKIEPSQETDQTALGLANQFAGESRNQVAFDANAQKKKLTRLVTPDILPTDYLIQGLGANRQLIRWVYDASVGDVSEPFNVGDKYVVALVTEVNKEGTMSPAKARNLVEPLIRNEKKAALIVKKIGTASTLDAVAAATAQKTQRADSIGFASPYIPNVGQEAKVVGMSFNKQLLGKPASPLIPGNTGVFMIKVGNVSAKPSFDADINQARKNQEQMQESILQRQAIDALKKEAKIKDNRGKFF